MPPLTSITLCLLIWLTVLCHFGFSMPIFQKFSRMQGCFDAIEKKYVSHIQSFPDTRPNKSVKTCLTVTRRSHNKHTWDVTCNIIHCVSLWLMSSKYCFQLRIVFLSVSIFYLLSFNVDFHIWWLDLVKKTHLNLNWGNVHSKYTIYSPDVWVFFSLDLHGPRPPWGRNTLYYKIIYRWLQELW